MPKSPAALEASHNSSQLLTTQKENPFKAKAYRAAAKQIETLPESIADLAQRNADFTVYSGIGQTIATAIHEIVSSGTSDRFFTQEHRILLYDAGPIVDSLKQFLLSECHVTEAQATGDFRRRAEILSEITLLIQTGNFAQVISTMKRFGGGSKFLSSENSRARFQLSSGLFLNLECAEKQNWGLAMLVATGSEAHLRQLQQRGPGLLKLAASRTNYPDESKVYKKLDLPFIPPELREGLDEIELASQDALPALIEVADIKGELHAHSTSSDGAHTIEQMAEAAQTRGYEYLGMTDHSQSLKIAHGLSEEALWKQIRHIEKLNEKTRGIRILKSAEVDILADGSLDYPDSLLKELDYTVCSIHSKFAMNKTAQTERILRAMDHKYFNILGHATGRKLLKRPGYEIDVDRVLRQARANGCFLEINSSPQRLDLSATNARLARQAGVKIAITTDAHATREFEYVSCGVDQARRAGLSKASVLNSLPWRQLQPLLRR